jgi:large subunit ribosomal protein L24
MLKIKRDDEVVVIAGKDKGKRGKVLRVLSDGRLLVAGINVVKKHQRGNPQAGVQGGIIEKEAGIQASNVAIWNAKTGRADRIGFRIEEDGGKVRFLKSDNTVLDV